MKDVQATGEAFSPQKRIYSALQNKKFINYFLFFWANFALFVLEHFNTAVQNQQASLNFLVYISVVDPDPAF
jgi:hypothetical protein